MKNCYLITLSITIIFILSIRINANENHATPDEKYIMYLQPITEEIIERDLKYISEKMKIPIDDVVEIATKFKAEYLEYSLFNNDWLSREAIAVFKSGIYSYKENKNIYKDVFDVIKNLQSGKVKILKKMSENVDNDNVFNPYREALFGLDIDEFEKGITCKYNPSLARKNSESFIRKNKDSVERQLRLLKIHENKNESKRLYNELSNMISTISFEWFMFRIAETGRI